MEEGGSRRCGIAVRIAVGPGLAVIVVEISLGWALFTLLLEG